MYQILNIFLFTTVSHLVSKLWENMLKLIKKNYWLIEGTPRVFSLHFSPMCGCVGFCRATAGGANESNPDWPWHHRLPAAAEAQVSSGGGGEGGPSFLTSWAQTELAKLDLLLQRQSSDSGWQRWTWGTPWHRSFSGLGGGLQREFIPTGAALTTLPAGWQRWRGQPDQRGLPQRAQTEPEPEAAGN